MKKLTILTIPVKTHENATDDSLLHLSFNYDGFNKWSCVIDQETMNDMVDMIKTRNYPTNANSIISIMGDGDDSEYCLPIEIAAKIEKHMRKLTKHIDGIADTPTRRAFDDKIVDVYRLLQNADKY